MSVVRLPGPVAKPASPTPRYVTIKTILQRTGIHRQTVHYYLRKELLPQPVRTSRTSALYPSSTIELIDMVHNLQRHQRLSLDEIVVLFRRHNYDVRAIRHGLAQTAQSPLQAVFGDQANALIPISEVADRIDPPPPREWVEKLLVANVLRSEKRNGREFISADTLEALRALWDGLRSGASIEQFQTLALSVDKEASIEFDQFLKNLHSLSDSKEAAPHVARLFSSLERFGAHRRRDALHHLFLDRLRKPGYMFLGPNRRYIFPSRTFLQKMGLFREMDLLLRRLDQNPHDLEALQNLVRASNVSSDWSRLHQAAQEILRVQPGDANAAASLGLALTNLGRLPEAISFLEEVIARGSNPMAKIRLCQALTAQAYESADAARLLDAVVRRSRLAVEAIKESAGNPGLLRKVRLNALLDMLYFSDPLRLNRPAEKEAREIYEEFRALSERKLPVLAKISLSMSRLYSCYALYLILDQEGNAKAAQLLNEIARIDPDCVLAARQQKTALAKKKLRGR
ncbi:MAG: MerR family transcriptional regulator [Acidobacteria bacterium]|nr:MerR family transcriptional regulator [Acidobacteriota bacterium]